MRKLVRAERFRRVHGFSPLPVKYIRFLYKFE